MEEWKMEWRKRSEWLTIPQERPFQAGYPDFSPYCHTKAIAIIHSATLDTWMAHVGKERALGGSWNCSWRHEPGSTKLRKWNRPRPSPRIPAFTWVLTWHFTVPIPLSLTLGNGILGVKDEGGFAKYNVAAAIAPVRAFQSTLLRIT